MASIAKMDGAGRTMRLDPYQKQHKFEMGSKSYKIDTKGVVVKKSLTCGLPMTMAVPAKAFKGVAARAIEDAHGNVTVTLELHHHDRELCVPLLCAHDMQDISADWHSWSRLMKLPMLIVGVDGEPTAVQATLGEIMIEQPWERRKRITTLNHRPNFLRRRKMGSVGPVEKLTAAEIIARR